MRALVSVLLVVCSVYATDKTSDTSVKSTSETCDTVFCVPGKECVMEDKKPVCACVERCAGDIGGPVCGSVDDTQVTYASKCNLYKDACENEGKKKIALIAAEACEMKDIEARKESVKIKEDAEKEKPVVCMAKDRDDLRKVIIELVGGKMAKTTTDDDTHKTTLLKYFNSLDLNGDSLLDTAEFAKITDDEKPILRGLCYTELIAITDHNSDYKLAFDEFHDCLNPEYRVPSMKCELGGSVFDDGEDVSSGCNTCTCACGHWVCKDTCAGKVTK